SNFSAGQFGFTPSFKSPPVLVPINPGMQFTPPPQFSSTASNASNGASSAGGNKSSSVDCEVR
ncbi:MAG: iron dicitrate transport regulator FecR, partial [Polaromonas sp.]